MNFSNGPLNKWDHKINKDILDKT